MKEQIDYDELIARIKKSEGCPRHENGDLKFYRCPAGKLTVGYGYNIEDNGFTPAQLSEFRHTGPTLEFAEFLLGEHLTKSAFEASTLFSARTWVELSAKRKSVIIDMCYNMGKRRLSKFKKMIAAIERGDYQDAADEMIDSHWHRQHLGWGSKRTVELIDEMLNG